MPGKCTGTFIRLAQSRKQLYLTLFDPFSILIHYQQIPAADRHCSGPFSPGRHMNAGKGNQSGITRCLYASLVLRINLHDLIRPMVTCVFGTDTDLETVLIFPYAHCVCHGNIAIGQAIPERVKRLLLDIAVRSPFHAVIRKVRHRFQLSVSIEGDRKLAGGRAASQQNISNQFPIVGDNGITYNNGERWDPQNSSVYDEVIVSLEIMPAENINFHLSRNR